LPLASSSPQRPPGAHCMVVLTVAAGCQT
jgi:hypothetical protein